MKGARETRRNPAARGTRGTWRGLALAAILLGLTTMNGAGCGARPEPLEKRFPNLVAHAGWNEQRLQNFVNASSTTPSSVYDLSVDNLPVMPVGAQIDAIGSRFATSSIFDIWLLHKNGLLDQDPSKSVAESTIKLSSNSQASSTSSRQDKSGGFSLGGLMKKVFFKASFSHQSDTATQTQTQSGQAFLSVAQTNWGTTLGILTSGIGGYGLEQFLIGPQFTAAQVAAWVSPQMAEGSQGAYVSDVFLQNGGVYTGAGEGPHAYVDLQLLNAMEGLFSQALTQYTAYGAPCQAAGATDCSAVRGKLLQNLATLKGAIIEAVAAFYQNYGNGFASQIEGVSEAVAIGNTDYQSTSTNKETGKSWGLSSSAKLINKSGVFGAGIQAGTGSYQENGNASAWVNATVTATSKPAGVVDTTAWASTVMTNVRAIANTNKLTVPPINVPASPALTPPDLVGELKNWSAPPDTCFKSISQWKQYQTEQQNMAVRDKLLNPNRTAWANFASWFRTGWSVAGESGLGEPTGGRVLMQAAPASIHTAIVREYAELRELRRERARERAAVAATATVTTDSPLNNVVRIPQAYTAGFTFTPYSQVFAELRPQLDIPEQPVQIFGGFPNAMGLLVAQWQMGALRSYVNFLSGFGASNVTPSVVASMEAMYQTLSAATNTTLEVALQTGQDVTDTQRSSLATYLFGTSSDMSDGALYQAAGDADVFSYLYHLLDPAPRSIWMAASGGYVPFAFDGTGRLGFLESRGSWWGPAAEALYAPISPVITPTTTPLSFYENTMYPQSPLYPVFSYLGSGGMNLFFVQTLGAYQVVWGRNYSYVPITASSLVPLSLIPDGSSCTPGYGSGVNPNSPTPGRAWSWLPYAWAYACSSGPWVPQSYPAWSLWEPGNSFLGGGLPDSPPYEQLPAELSWDYYLPWPATSQLAAFQVLTLSFDPTDKKQYAETGWGDDTDAMAGFGHPKFAGTTLNLAPTAKVKFPRPVVALTGPASATAGVTTTLSWNVTYLPSGATLTLSGSDGSSQLVTGTSASVTPKTLPVTYTLTVTSRFAPAVSGTFTLGGMGSTPRASLPAAHAAAMTVTPTSWYDVTLSSVASLSGNGVRLMLLPVNSTSVPGWGGIVGTNSANLNYLPAASYQDLIRNATPALPGTFDDAFDIGLLGTNIDCSAAAKNPNCARTW